LGQSRRRRMFSVAISRALTLMPLTYTVVSRMALTFTMKDLYWGVSAALAENRPPKKKRGSVVLAPEQGGTPECHATAILWRAPRNRLLRLT
jgi:hypothetical protein